MTVLEIEDRVLRLEQTLTALAVLISGEAQRVGTAQEFQALTERLAKNLAAMADEVASRP